MEFDSLDVEKDFPGLYASEDTRSKKSTKEDSDFSEGENDKVSKKDLLIGRRKDKKDKGKDRGYAALKGGESSQEEDIDAKSPSKSKKSLAFKFTSSKSKEKREKSRDKSEKEVEEKVKEKDKPEKEKEKKKDKERKDKDKKDKERKDKEKEKSYKKTKQQTSHASEEILELGDVQPVFGVNISLATERSRCHDGTDLPLVVRDCIDYLQENALCNEQIYKVEAAKSRLQHFKRLYNNREHQPESDELDLPTACNLLKLFLCELPEPMLTTDLMACFEEVATYAQARQQQELQQLLQQLPRSNKTLLCWIFLHFDEIIKHEKSNKMNAQSLAMLFSSTLQMSQRLFMALLCHCNTLFPDVKLNKYVPPITASSPNLPETSRDIQTELLKQESLLAQIHAEMNAGFVSKKREEQLWEVQRIITQLKRTLRTVEKRQEKSMEESLQQQQNDAAIDVTDARQTESATSAKTAVLVKQCQLSDSDEEEAATNKETIDLATKTTVTASIHVPTTTTTAAAAIEEQQSIAASEDSAQSDEIYLDDQTGLMMAPKTHADYKTLLRLQLENQELIKWKDQLQARILAERAEILHLKQSYQQQEARINGSSIYISNNNNSSIIISNNDLKLLEDVDDDYERVIEHFVRENTLLEQKRNMLAKEIFDERRECIALHVELALQKL